MNPTRSYTVYFSPDTLETFESLFAKMNAEYERRKEHINDARIREAMEMRLAVLGAAIKLCREPVVFQ